MTETFPTHRVAISLRERSLPNGAYEIRLSPVHDPKSNPFGH